MNFALVGNPNSGKTTLFNRLTGSRAHVGNWPGVTVERREGAYRGHNFEIGVIDLPGIYSLSPYSEEEVITRDFILKSPPALIINIVDATNLERSLYLTTQLLETGIPLVVALNMMDEVNARGDSIDSGAIEKALGIPVIPISAAKGDSVDLLIERAVLFTKARSYQPKTVLTGTAAFPYIQHILDITDTRGKVGALFAAAKILELDERVLAECGSQSLADKLKRLVGGTEWDEYIADARYRYIEKLVNSAVVRRHMPGAMTLSDKVDMLVTNKFLAIPLFLGVMFTIFQITFGSSVRALSNFLDRLINGTLASLLNSALTSLGAADWLSSLIISGIIPGAGMILVFLPQILTLFLFLSLLEGSGYMARAAFIMDRLLRKFGLSGKAFVPMLMGFGCSVPAIMACRTLESERDRRLTIILTPFMSCGARMPVYAVFAGALFPNRAGTVIFSLYILGIAAAVISGIFLKNTVLQGESATFIMELPPYRMPSPKNLLLNMWEKGRGFVERAGTILVAASIVIWFLQSFDFSLNMTADPTRSIFGAIGKTIAPVFAPLGFGDWRSSVALLTGFIAKEMVVSTLGILHGVGEGHAGGLYAVLTGAYTPLSAYSFMAFVLLYIPCIVALATTKREMNSWKWTAFAAMYQICTAWIVAFLIYQGGSILGF